MTDSSAHPDSLASRRRSDRFSANEPATDLSDIRRQTIRQRPGVEAGRVLTSIYRVGDEIANQLRDGYPTLGCHGIEAARHGSVKPNREMTLSSLGARALRVVGNALAGLVLPPLNRLRLAH